MDAVYILGAGSMSKNEEIRYSVRSLETNMLDLRNIYVVGDKPEMLQNIIHIPASDSTDIKWVNALTKIRKACSVPELSDEFLLMNDDFFMLEPFDGADFPFYALKGSNGGNCGQHSFHIHCPIRLNKEFYLKMGIDPDTKGQLSPRTFYANFYQAPPVFTTDFILRVGKEDKNYDLQTKNWPCFSITDPVMLHDDFIKWLDELYPVPSRFEII